jgi:hypothetical protein
MVFPDVDRCFVEGSSDARGRFLAQHAVPQRRVGSVAIGGVGAVDDVGHRAVFRETAKGNQHFRNFRHHPRGSRPRAAMNVSRPQSRNHG